MNYTVIGVWLDDKPVVVGAIPGHHEVYGGDEETFGEGLWFCCVNADDVAEAEQMAKVDVIENNV
jgi:hypothetical protein